MRSFDLGLKRVTSKHDITGKAAINFPWIHSSNPLNQWLNRSSSKTVCVRPVKDRTSGSRLINSKGHND